MTNIAISKINEAYVGIHTEPHVEEELSEFFTFMAHDYQFSPLYKAKKWDGKIRLFNKRTKRLPAGLQRYLHQFAKEHSYVLSGDLYVAENHSLKESKDFLADLRLAADGNAIEARDYQIDAITKGLRYRNCVLLSPTASGKSLIIYTIVRYLLQKKLGKRGLLIVPTTSLVEQMYSDFKDYSTINGWDVDKHCQKIYEGFTKVVTSDLTISTWQSIADFSWKSDREMEKFFAQFDFVMGDEAHHFKAKSLGKIMNNLVNAKYRIGTTGTIDEDAETHKLAIEGHFGPTLKIISTSELMARGDVADLTIKCLVLKYPLMDCITVNKMTYPEEMDFLVKHKIRNNFISNLALSLKENTLILFQYVEKHGEKLYAELLTKNKDPNRKIFFISGKTDVENRELVRKIMETEKGAILVASYGVFSTGINIKNLHNLIFASPSKSKYRVLQSIGRELRISSTKDSATLFDIVDDLRSGNHTNYSMRHYVLRVKIYHQEKFNIKSYNIGLDQ